MGAGCCEMLPAKLLRSSSDVVARKLCILIILANLQQLQAPPTTFKFNLERRHNLGRSLLPFLSVRQHLFKHTNHQSNLSKHSSRR